ncbi:hypothetical protein cyc_08364 [Cyclospora cayetanensis]|uniref:RAP domain-containing protein n=1 Tax=Cyclospora cayetanensis TaxID=88456 RepID=A0A1D3D8A5_9EIME|nr:hypothetical protein cyc_08364 [Cyclospora cayetanensis]
MLLLASRRLTHAKPSSPTSQASGGGGSLWCSFPSSSSLRAVRKHDGLPTQEEQEDFGDDEDGFVSAKSEDAPTRMWVSCEAELLRQQQQQEAPRGDGRLQQHHPQQHAAYAHQQRQQRRRSCSIAWEQDEEEGDTAVSAAVCRCETVDELLQLLHNVAASTPLRQQPSSVLLRALHQLAVLAGNTTRHPSSKQQRPHHVSRFPIVKVGFFPVSPAVDAASAHQDLLAALQLCGTSLSPPGAVEVLRNLSRLNLLPQQPLLQSGDPWRLSSNSLVALWQAADDMPLLQQQQGLLHPLVAITTQRLNKAAAEAAGRAAEAASRDPMRLEPQHAVCIGRCAARMRLGCKYTSLTESFGRYIRDWLAVDPPFHPQQGLQLVHQHWRQRGSAKDRLLATSKCLFALARLEDQQQRAKTRKQQQRATFQPAELQKILVRLAADLHLLQPQEMPLLLAAVNALLLGRQQQEDVQQPFSNTAVVEARAATSSAAETSSASGSSLQKGAAGPLGVNAIVERYGIDLADVTTALHHLAILSKQHPRQDKQTRRQQVELLLDARMMRLLSAAADYAPVADGSVTRILWAVHRIEAEAGAAVRTRATDAVSEEEEEHKQQPTETAAGDDSDSLSLIKNPKFAASLCNAVLRGLDQLQSAEASAVLLALAKLRWLLLPVQVSRHEQHRHDAADMLHLVWQMLARLTELSVLPSAGTAGDGQKPAAAEAQPSFPAADAALAAAADTAWIEGLCGSLESAGAELTSFLAKEQAEPPSGFTPHMAARVLHSGVAAAAERRLAGISRRTASEETDAPIKTLTPHNQQLLKAALLAVPARAEHRATSLRLIARLLQMLPPNATPQLSQVLSEANRLLQPIHQSEENKFQQQQQTVSAAQTSRTPRRVLSKWISSHWYDMNPALQRLLVPLIEFLGIQQALLQVLDCQFDPLQEHAVQQHRPAAAAARQKTPAARQQLMQLLRWKRPVDAPPTHRQLQQLEHRGTMWGEIELRVAARAAVAASDLLREWQEEPNSEAAQLLQPAVYALLQHMTKAASATPSDGAFIYLSEADQPEDQCSFALAEDSSASSAAFPDTQASKTSHEASPATLTAVAAALLRLRPFMSDMQAAASTAASRQVLLQLCSAAATRHAQPKQLLHLDRHSAVSQAAAATLLLRELTQLLQPTRTAASREVTLLSPRETSEIFAAAAKLLRSAKQTVSSLPRTSALSLVQEAAEIALHATGKATTTAAKDACDALSAAASLLRLSCSSFQLPMDAAASVAVVAAAASMGKLIAALKRLHPAVAQAASDLAAHDSGSGVPAALRQAADDVDAAQQDSSAVHATVEHAQVPPEIEKSNDALWGAAVDALLQQAAPLGASNVLEWADSAVTLSSTGLLQHRSASEEILPGGAAAAPCAEQTDARGKHLEMMLYGYGSQRSFWQQNVSSLSIPNNKNAGDLLMQRRGAGSSSRRLTLLLLLLTAATRLGAFEALHWQSLQPTEDPMDKEAQLQQGIFQQRQQPLPQLLRVLRLAMAAAAFPPTVALQQERRESQQALPQTVPGKHPGWNSEASSAYRALVRQASDQAGAVLQQLNMAATAAKEKSASYSLDSALRRLQGRGVSVLGMLDCLNKLRLVHCTAAATRQGNSQSSLQQQQHQEALFPDATLTSCCRKECAQADWRLLLKRASALEGNASHQLSALHKGQQEGSQLAVEADGPLHFVWRCHAAAQSLRPPSRQQKRQQPTEPTQQYGLTALTALKRDLLQHTGVPFIAVDTWRWAVLRDSREKQQFVLQLLQEQQPLP